MHSESPLSGHAPEYAIAAVKDSIRNGDYRYSVGGCLTPLIENYIRKYNAECSGEKRQDGFRAALERLGISPAQQHEILHLSADSPCAGSRLEGNRAQQRAHQEPAMFSQEQADVRPDRMIF